MTELDDSARAGFVPADRPSETIGYSDAWDFAEAFREAIGMFRPGLRANISDWLYTYEVTSIGAEIGGIVGFSRMHVKVRG